MLLVVALLGFGLLALLLLNTASAQDAFRLSDLQRQSKALADQEQSLSRQAAALSDPASVAAAATRLGMVPGAVPIFLAPGQKVPAGEIIGGMLIVPAPRPTPAAHPTQPPAAAQQPKPKQTTPAAASTTKPAAKTPATTTKSISPAEIKFLKQLRDFNNYAKHVAAQSAAAKGAPSTGSHP